MPLTQSQRRLFVFRFITYFLAAFAFTAAAQNSGANDDASFPSLRQGDIVFTDSGNAMQGGYILKLDRQTGARCVLSHGGYLGFHGFPNAVTVSPAGQVFVANERCLLRIDPETGEQFLVREARGAPGLFWGVAADRKGDLFVAVESAVMRVDSETGEMQTVSSEGFFTFVLSIAVNEKDGALFVTNARFDVARGGWAGEIIRVNPHNGRQTIISRAGYLNFLLGITAHGEDIYVTGTGAPDGDFGKGRVIRVNARTGDQALVSQAGSLVRPVGIASDARGQLVVADPYTVNPQSRDLASGGYDGSVLGIDPATGEQSVIARGQGELVNPCGVAVVPESASADENE